MTVETWTQDVEESIDITSLEVANLLAWGRAMEIPGQVLEGMIEPYREMLEGMFRAELPLAWWLDQTEKA